MLAAAGGYAGSTVSLPESWPCAVCVCILTRSPWSCTSETTSSRMTQRRMTSDSAHKQPPYYTTQPKAQVKRTRHLPDSKGRVVY